MKRRDLRAIPMRRHGDSDLRITVMYLCACVVYSPPMIARIILLVHLKNVSLLWNVSLMEKVSCTLVGCNFLLNRIVNGITCC